MAVLSDRGNSDDRDRLHLDEIVRVRERADLHHRRGRALGAEELLAHGPEVRTVAHVGDVGGDLDDAIERAAPGLDERLDRGEDRARLRLEVAAVLHPALRVVGDLPGREEQRLGARHPDALAVAWRIVHAGRPVLLDLRHARLLSPPDHMSLSGFRFGWRYGTAQALGQRGARVAAGEAGRERQGVRPAALITLRAPA